MAMVFFWTLWIIGILFAMGAFPISGSFLMRVLLGILILLFWPIMLGIMVRNVYVKYINE
jgi:hypothetical protein